MSFLVSSSVGDNNLNAKNTVDPGLKGEASVKPPSPQEVTLKITVDSPENVIVEIKEANKKTKNWKVSFAHALNFVGSIILGGLTLTAIVAGFSNPIGWAIGISCIVIGLIGVAYYGGIEEFKDALKVTSIGFLGSAILTHFGVSLLLAAGSACFVAVVKLVWKEKSSSE